MRSTPSAAMATAVVCFPVGSYGLAMSRSRGIHGAFAEVHAQEA